MDIGVEAARKYKESEAVIHAIHAHHGDVEPKTIIACIVQAADAISAARPGARRENLENYIKRLEKLEEVASSFDGVDRCYAIQAGREVRVIVKPEVIGDDKMVLLARDICKKIESDLEYPGQIKVNIDPREPRHRIRKIRILYNRGTFGLPVFFIYWEKLFIKVRISLHKCPILCYNTGRTYNRNLIQRGVSCLKQSAPRKRKPVLLSIF